MAKKTVFSYEQDIREHFLREDTVGTIPQILKFGTPKPEGTFDVYLESIDTIAIFCWDVDTQGSVAPHFGKFVLFGQVKTELAHKLALFRRFVKLLNAGNTRVMGWAGHRLTDEDHVGWERFNSMLNAIEFAHESENEGRS